MANDTDGKIFVGKSEKPEYLTLRLANRHGLATGATGTGKTVTLQVLAEGFSRAGVPVFAADIKGDLSGVAALGEPKDFLLKRAKDIGIEYQPDEFPVVFWDLFGEQGHPIRTTRVRDGAAADLAHAQPQRHPGRRHQHRLQVRRRRSAARRLRLERPGRPARICASC